MSGIALSDAEFAQFQRFIHEAAGICMSPSKKALVCGRLAKRLQHWRLPSYGKYLELLCSGSAPAEVQMAVDLLTTNETYFFREPRHFELLRELAAAARGGRQPFRVWSAASSTGEEPYSIAMVLADALGASPWDVLGSDISSRVLQRARTGHYPLERTRHIPPACLKRYCLRGTGPEDGTLLVERSLRQRVHFMQVNLNTTLPQLGQFDVIFLRNVMIYFNGETKRQVVARVLSALRPGGHFCIGHSESLNDVSSAVVPVAPSIYRKP
jgi:chemotaxis protein methyltransferase CheR